MALWTPASTTTAAWFDASDASTITESGGAVSQWNDKSGNSYNLAQGTGAAQPVTGSSTINSLNAMAWTTAKFMSSATPAGANWQDVYVVAKWTGAGTFSTYNGLFTGSNNSGTDGGIGWIGHTGSVNSYTGTKWWDNLYLNGTSSTGAAVLPTMASDFVVDFSANSPISVTGMTVGRDRTYSGRGWEGLIGEVIAFNSKLSTADRQKTEGYLAWKWGTEGSLPAAHPYKSAAPTQIGITSITPATGPGATPTSVTIAGTDFDVSTPTVTIDGEPCTSVSVASAISLTCNTPLSFTAGAKDVVATNSTGTFTLAGGFTYAAPLQDRQQVGSVFQDWRRAEAVEGLGSVFTEWRRSETVDTIGSVFTDHRRAEIVEGIGSVLGIPALPATTVSVPTPSLYNKLDAISGTTVTSAVGNDGASTGTVTQVAEHPSGSGNSLQFSSAALLFDTTPLNNTTTFTISWWERPTSLSSYDYRIDWRVGSGYRFVYPQSSTTALGYYGSNFTSMGITLAANVWRHYAMTCNAGDFVIYQNGAANGTTFTDGRYALSTDLTLANAEGNTTYGITGQMAEFAIWNSVLGAAEIAAIYDSGTPPDLTTGITGGPNPTKHYFEKTFMPGMKNVWFM